MHVTLIDGLICAEKVKIYNLHTLKYQDGILLYTIRHIYNKY